MKLSWVVNRVFSSRTYLLETEKEAWLVDCGDWEKLLQDGDLPLRGVLLTHVHYDHIYGIPGLLERFPECRIYTNAAGVEAFASPKNNMSRYHDDPITLDAARLTLVGEGDRIPLAPGLEAEVFETPGHNPSCLTYRVADLLFTGDSYIPGEKVVTTLPGGDKPLAAASLERILRLADGLQLCPGHEIWAPGVISIK